jgi:hypothetical protein
MQDKRRETHRHSRSTQSNADWNREVMQLAAECTQLGRTITEAASPLRAEQRAARAKAEQRTVRLRKLGVTPTIGRKL